jgi:hypothetical protein
LVAVSITETVPSVLLATYAKFPSGVIAIPVGEAPTVIGGPTVVLVLVSITETELAKLLVTYAKFPLGVIAIWLGPVPTATPFTTILVLVSIT